MRQISIIGLVCLLGGLPGLVFAEEGVDRMGQGTVDVITSPGQIVEGVEEETAERGGTGVVTGTAKGAIEAAGQAAKGGVEIGVGAVEAITKPLRD